MKNLKVIYLFVIITLIRKKYKYNRKIMKKLNIILLDLWIKKNLLYLETLKLYKKLDNSAKSKYMIIFSSGRF